MSIDIATRLRTIAGAYQGEVFRLDGANFVILYRQQAQSEDVGRALVALQAGMQRPFSCRTHEVFSHLSLGAVEYPRHGGDAVCEGDATASSRFVVRLPAA